MKYPYKLESIAYASKEVRENSEKYILDSGIQDPSISNKQVIEKAKELKADVVIPKDYLQDQKKTTESIGEFLSLVPDSPNFDYWIPLQPPYDEHYKKVTERYGEFEKYVLGGIAKLGSENKKIEELWKFREVAGFQKKAHALGVGGSEKLIQELRNNPRLLDSLDLSTPIKLVTKDEILDRKFNRQEFEYPKGELSTSLRAIISDFILYEMNHALTDGAKFSSNSSQQKLEDVM